MRPARRVSAAGWGAALLIFCVACERTPAPERASPDSARAVAAADQLTFDPARVRAGDGVGSLIVDTVDARWSEALETWVGTIRFRGEIPLRGHLIRHFDPEVRTLCFEADSASARRLPRWPGDERRPWFCFENDSAVSADIGELRSIVVDRFTSVRAFTDAVNTARFLDRSLCFRSAGPILGRLAPGAEGARTTARLRFDGGLALDSGLVEVREEGGASLLATWRRRNDGGLDILGADDFVRLEARVVPRGDSLVGNARLSSDAQLERDSTGRLAASAREWRLAARAIPCEPAR